MVLGKFIAFVEQWIVHRLSNNRSFQKFAVKMDDTIQSKQKIIQENVKNIKENVNAKTDGGFNPANFFRNFAEEVKKEMSNIQNSQNPPKK